MKLDSSLQHDVIKATKKISQPE